MATIFTYLQFGLGRLFYLIRGHDSRQFTNCRAFKYCRAPNMTLESSECGSTGSSMLDYHTFLDEDGVGKFPELRWAPPIGEVKEYVLVCEDLDLPIPCLVIHHGLFFHIPPTTTTACHADVVKQEGNLNAHVTNSGWMYITNLRGSSYIGPAPPLGHGSHRYVFTIVALNKPLDFSSHEKITKDQIKEVMVGKVIGWGQWTGVFQRPWPVAEPEFARIDNSGQICVHKV